MYYKAVHEFLGPELRKELLDFVIRREPDFQTSGTGNTGIYDQSIRKSRVLWDLGPFKSLIDERVRAIVPACVSELGLSGFQPAFFETEIAAHGHGAFFRRHIDLATGEQRAARLIDRVLSVVYYFYREPRAFSGGMLRLFPPSATSRPGGPKVLDIEVEQDTAVAFSSWVPHEVLDVFCPSGAFGDSRFAINCWVCRAKAPV